jgi:hypothetical protein
LREVGLNEDGIGASFDEVAVVLGGRDLATEAIGGFVQVDFEVCELL